MEPSDATCPGDSIQEDALSRLIDFNARLSMWLAKGRSLSQEGMNRLAFECSERVQCILASRSDADSPLLDQLAFDRSASVRLRVACNAASSVDTLSRLAVDDDAMVSAAATENLDARRVRGKRH